LIQIQVERQHVDTRLAEDPELAAFYVLLDYLADGIRAYAAGLGHAVHLGVSRGRADVRVQTARGGRE
jgi:hypothetical protein